MNSLNLEQLSLLEGGTAKDVHKVINTACFVAGAAVIFGAVMLAPAVAFCLGWGAGAAYDHWNS